MASVTTSKRTGRKRLLFLDKEGDRRTIGLGNMKDREANEVKEKVESILDAASVCMDAPRKTWTWLRQIPDSLHIKLAKAGLVEPRQPEPEPEPPPVVTVGAFTADYIRRRAEAKTKERTILNLDMFRDRLIKTKWTGNRRRGGTDGRFEPGRDITTITRADAEDWLVWLKEHYSPATAGRTLKGARQFFNRAVKAKLIAENPFDDLKAESNPDESRQRFISQEDIERVLAMCPDAQWRLMVALSRYGGLRCPSEHMALRWADIDWEAGKIRIRSPMTAHHAGKAERTIPLFRELRPYLKEAFDPEAEHVITTYRDSAGNLRTQFARIVRKAGLQPWPKLFHNLRASRETELAAVHPLHVVCKWIGNNAAVAQKHYLQVTEADFERARKRTRATPEMARTDARSTSMHNDAQFTQPYPEMALAGENAGNVEAGEYAWRDSKHLKNTGNSAVFSTDSAPDVAAPDGTDSHGTTGLSLAEILALCCPDCRAKILAAMGHAPEGVQDDAGRDGGPKAT
jgi:integrase